MIKIAFINRAEGYSIEEIFNALKNELGDYAYEDFKMTGLKKSFSNVLNVKKFRPDLVHITGGEYYISIFFKTCRLISTYHDIGHYENTLSGVKKYLFKILYLTLPLKYSDVITVVSNYTKKKLIENFNIEEDKIRVIYNPCPKEIIYVPKHFNDKKPTILQIGGKKNKNHTRLIEACKSINCEILFIRKLTSDDKKLLRKYDINYTEYYDLKYDQVLQCYQKADLVYFASTYEGFGMPIIEAQKTGRPIITSNICSMPEIAGRGAKFVNPYSVEEIRDAILEIINNTKLREELIQLGKTNVKRFDLALIVDQYEELYKGLLNK